MWPLNAHAGQSGLHCKPYATSLCSTQLNQNTRCVKYTPPQASVYLSKHGYTLWAGCEAKLSGRMRESSKTTSGEVCVCVRTVSNIMWLCACACMCLCGYWTVTVDAGVFVCVCVSGCPWNSTVNTEAFAHCRINLLNQSHSAPYLCGAEGVVLVLYLV